MDLFSSANLRIVEENKTTHLSAGQKKFNRLINKINQGRATLQAWQTAILQYQQKYISELQPVIKSYLEYRVAMLERLDQVYTQYSLTKKEKSILEDVIQQLARVLIEEEGMDELKEIYNKYSRIDYDEEIDADRELFNEMTKNFFGFDLDEDVDMNSIHDIFMNLGKKMHQQMEQESQASPTPKRERKKSAKTLAKEAREKEEEQQVSQSIREVFRALAKSLHPDREQDAAERERKNILMQRANVAYKQKDLLALLELQLEVEQIDQDSIGSIAEDRLKHYNKVLKEQLLELEREIEMVQVRFMMQYDIEPNRKLSAQQVMVLFSMQLRDLKFNLNMVKKDSMSLKNAKGIKQFLKLNPQYDYEDF